MSIESALAPTLELLHGAQMPRLGLGTGPLRGVDAAKTVTEAIDAGYRLVDTAFAYRNEEIVGRGLKASSVPREDVFVTTKFNGQSHSVAGAQQAFADGARLLGVDYVDLLMIHWPLPAQDRYVDAWRGLIKLLEKGDVRAIGMSNFKPAHLDRLLAETGVTPDVNQIQLNPRLARVETRAYNAEHGIVTESWSPLGSGSDLLAEPVITKLAEAVREDTRPDRPALAHGARPRRHPQVVEPRASACQHRYLRLRSVGGGRRRDLGSGSWRVRGDRFGHVGPLTYATASRHFPLIRPWRTLVHPV